MNKGKLLPPVYLVISLVLALAFDYYAPVARVVPGPWNWAGIALIAGGLALIVSQAMVFKSKGTAIKPFDESSVLIQDGLCWGLRRLSSPRSACGSFCRRSSFASKSACWKRSSAISTAPTGARSGAGCSP